jgi:uncharacterized protein (TIGR03086 family)
MSMDILLARAVSYALKAAALLTPGDLSRPTPCTEWDLNLLLHHLCDSMATLDEAIGTGRLDAAPKPVATDGNPVELLRDRAAELLCSMFTMPDRMIEVSGLPVPPRLIVGAGAIEIAVHGWDVYAASGHGRIVPAALARPLIRLFPQVISVRTGLFDGPFAVPPCASPGDRLVAYLGRDPAARHKRPSPSSTGYSRVA